MSADFSYISLFSGILGLDLGLERAGWRPILFAEADERLNLFIQRKRPKIEIYKDVRDVSKAKANLICGGFPCQPHSINGHQRGEEDQRHLWPEMARIIRTNRPRWVVAENVAGILSTIHDRVLNDFEAERYTVKPIIFSGRSIGAPHERERVFYLAYSSEVRSQGMEFKHWDSFPGPFEEGIAGRWMSLAERWWKEGATVAAVPAIDGLPDKLVRIGTEALGNAVIPQIGFLIGWSIAQVERTLLG